MQHAPHPLGNQIFVYFLNGTMYLFINGRKVQSRIHQKNIEGSQGRLQKFDKIGP